MCAAQGGKILGAANFSKGLLVPLIILAAVSYTHLDVYKRQDVLGVGSPGESGNQHEARST